VSDYSDYYEMKLSLAIINDSSDKILISDFDKLFHVNLNNATH